MCWLPCLMCALFVGALRVATPRWPSHSHLTAQPAASASDPFYGRTIQAKPAIGLQCRRKNDARIRSAPCRRLSARAVPGRSLRSLAMGVNGPNPINTSSNESVSNLLAETTMSAGWKVGTTVVLCGSVNRSARRPSAGLGPVEFQRQVLAQTIEDSGCGVSRVRFARRRLPTWIRRVAGRASTPGLEAGPPLCAKKRTWRPSTPAAGTRRRRAGW